MSALVHPERAFARVDSTAGDALSAPVPAPTGEDEGLTGMNGQKYSGLFAVKATRALPRAGSLGEDDRRARAHGRALGERGPRSQHEHTMI